MNLSGERISAEITVGITAAGGGIAQSVIDSLQTEKQPMRIIAMDSSPWAFGAYLCDAFYKVPAFHSPDYCKRILEICEVEGIDVLIPGSDLELLPLAGLRNQLKSINTECLVSGAELISLCRDKYLLGAHLAKAKVPYAETFLFSEAQKRSELLTYPVVIKPKSGSSSDGVRIAYGPGELESLAFSDQFIVQRLLGYEKEMPGADKSRNSFSEILQREEFSCHVFVGKSGRIISRFTSMNTLRRGVPIRITPVENPDINVLIDRAVLALSPFGLQGPCNFQGKLKDGSLVLFEVNPRFTGITNIRAMMGFREVFASIKHLFCGWQEDKIEPLLSFNPGLLGIRLTRDLVVNKRSHEAVSNKLYINLNGHSKRVLITGASGHLGSAVTEILNKDPEIGKLLLFSRDASHLHQYSQEKIVHKFWNEEEIRFSLDDVDTVIHCAAARPLIKDVALTRQVNENEFADFLALVKKSTAQRFVFISSQSVYGKEQSPPWDEHSSLFPESVYAQTKHSGELLTKYLLNNKKWVILRLAKLIGGSSNFRHSEMPHLFAMKALQNEDLTVFGDGNQQLDLLNVHDAASAISLIIQQSNLVWNETYNLGPGKSVSTLEVAKTCLRVAQKFGAGKGKIIMDSEQRAGSSFGMNIDKLRSATDWRPHYSIEQSIEEIMEYLSCQTK